MDRSTRVDVTRKTHNGTVIKMYFKDDQGRCNTKPDITISTSKNVKQIGVAIKPSLDERSLDSRQLHVMNIPAADTSADEMIANEEIKNNDIENEAYVKNINYNNKGQDHQSSHLSSLSKSLPYSSEETLKVMHDPNTDMQIYIPTPIRACDDLSYNPFNIPPPNTSPEDQNCAPQNISTPKTRLNNGNDDYADYHSTPRTSIQNIASPKLPTFETFFENSWKSDYKDELADHPKIHQQNLDIKQQQLGKGQEVSDKQLDDDNEDDNKPKQKKELSTLFINDIDQQNHDYDQLDSSSSSE